MRHVLPTASTPLHAAAALATFKNERPAQQTVAQRVRRVVRAGQLAARAAAEQALQTASPTVSVLAASLPGAPTAQTHYCAHCFDAIAGIKLHGFHVDKPALPSLSAGTWQRLVHSSRSHPGYGMATLLFAAPQTTTHLPTFLLRLVNMLPGMPVIGGVTDVGSNNQQQAAVGLDVSCKQPALFLGGEAHASGAVGVVMEGPVCLEPLRWASCRDQANGVQHDFHKQPGVQQSNCALLVYGVHPLLGTDTAGMPVHGAHMGTQVVGRACYTQGTAVGVLRRAT